MWTDEKHSLFLENLEVSFVKQLHQSTSLLAWSSDQDEEGRRIMQINARNTPEQLAFPLHGCGEKSKCNSYDPLSHVSVNPLACIQSPRVYRSKHIRMERLAASARAPEKAASARAPESPAHRNARNFRKVAQPRRSDTCSLKFSASDSHTKEGTGQNFVDEGNATNSETESRGKRLKIVAR